MGTETSTRYWRRIVVAVLSIGIAATVSACGFDDQTLQPYTQAEGVNTDVGANPQTSAAGVKVRNLMVISDAAGSGFLSGQLTSDEGDGLTNVRATALSADGAPVGELTLAGQVPITVQPGAAIQLSDYTPSITVKGNGLVAGLTTEMTLTFAKSGSVTLAVPIIDGNKADFKTVKPKP